MTEDTRPEAEVIPVQWLVPGDVIMSTVHGDGNISIRKRPERPRPDR